MNRAVIFLFLVMMTLGWLAYEHYGRNAVKGYADDVQAYQKRSLLP